jgi:hypothetical protein
MDFLRCPQIGTNPESVGHSLFRRQINTETHEGKENRATQWNKALVVDLIAPAVAEMFSVLLQDQFLQRNPDAFYHMLPQPGK